jgi:hypothetical protein
MPLVALVEQHLCTPSNSGSAISLRSNSPDVTTSMRVRCELRESPRTA